MSKREPKRRHEFVDPNPMSMPVKFQRPPTLAEQIARFMGAHQRYVESQQDESAEEAEDFTDPEDEDNPSSPHELVFDKDLNREITRFQKEHLDKQRAAFDKAIRDKMQQELTARALAEKAERNATRKKAKDVEPTPSDESDDE